MRFIRRLGMMCAALSIVIASGMPLAYAQSSASFVSDLAAVRTLGAKRDIVPASERAAVTRDFMAAVSRALGDAATPEEIAAVISVAVSAAPDLAPMIVRTAIAAMPSQAVNITTAALNAAPNSPSARAAIVNAAIQSAPRSDAPSLSSLLNPNLRFGSNPANTNSNGLNDTNPNNNQQWNPSPPGTGGNRQASPS